MFKKHLTLIWMTIAVEDSAKECENAKMITLYPVYPPFHLLDTANLSVVVHHTLNPTLPVSLAKNTSLFADLTFPCWRSMTRTTSKSAAASLTQSLPCSAWVCLKGVHMFCVVCLKRGLCPEWVYLKGYISSKQWMDTHPNSSCM